MYVSRSKRYFPRAYPRCGSNGICGTVSSVNSLCTFVSGIDCVAAEPAKCMIVYKWESPRQEGSGVCGVCVCVGCVFVYVCVGCVCVCVWCVCVCGVCVCGVCVCVCVCGVAVNLCFLDLEPLLFFIQVATQLTSRG